MGERRQSLADSFAYTTEGQAVIGLLKIASGLVTLANMDAALTDPFIE